MVGTALLSRPVSPESDQAISVTGEFASTAADPEFEAYLAKQTEALRYSKLLNVVVHEINVDRPPASRVSNPNDWNEVVIHASVVNKGSKPVSTAKIVIDMAGTYGTPAVVTTNLTFTPPLAPQAIHRFSIFDSLVRVGWLGSTSPSVGDVSLVPNWVSDVEIASLAAVEDAAPPSPISVTRILVIAAGSFLVGCGTVCIGGALVLKPNSKLEMPEEHVEPYAVIS